MHTNFYRPHSLASHSKATEFSTWRGCEGFSAHRFPRCIPQAAQFPAGLLRAFAAGWAPQAATGRQRERCFRGAGPLCSLPGAAGPRPHKLGGAGQETFIPSQSRRPEVQNQGVSRPRLPPKALGEGPPRVFRRLGFVGCGHIAPPLPLLHACAVPVSVFRCVKSPSSYKSLDYGPPTPV